MAVRSTMAALISRVRTLISDPSGASETFADQDIQDALDESRIDLRYLGLDPRPTYSGGTLQFLDYYVPRGFGMLEGDWALWQYLYVAVTPASNEPILGHFTFATSTLPPIYIIGKSYDVWRAAADLLERKAAIYATRFDFTQDGQSFRVSQAQSQLLDLALHYRMKQRVIVGKASRNDLAPDASEQAGNLGPIALDYFSSGNPGGG